MNEAWKNIFKNFIKCYEAIEILGEYHVLDVEQLEVAQEQLLDNIIDTFRSEVEK